YPVGMKRVLAIFLFVVSTTAFANPPDPDGAKCARGDSDACFRVFKKNCDAGSGPDCDALAGQEQRRGNLKEAERLYRHGCDEKRWAACYGLGTVLASSGNKTEAVKVYRTACNQGSSGSCRDGGKLLDLSSDGSPFQSGCT